MSRISSDMKTVRVALEIMRGQRRNVTPLPDVAANAMAAWQRVDKVLFAHICEATLRHIRREQHRKTPRSKL